MRIRMLIENEKLDNHPELEKEHGLSMLLSTNGENILFDTGATGKFIDNADKMGINIEDIDTLVISHGHYDHGGGLSRFLERNKKARVIMHSKAREKHYIKVLFKKFDASIPETVFNNYSNRITFIDETTEISRGVFIITDAVKIDPWVKFNKRMLIKKEGKFVADDLKHEITLAVENDKKLVIVTGCSHNGVINMIKSVESKLPGMPIQSVIGGFHIIGESEQTVRELGRQLSGFNIEKTYTCHCTGKKSYKVLKDELKERIDYLCTGRDIEL